MVLFSLFLFTASYKRRKGIPLLLIHSGDPINTRYNLFIILIYYYCTFAYTILLEILCCYWVRSRGRTLGSSHGTSRGNEENCTWDKDRVWWVAV